MKRDQGPACLGVGGDRAWAALGTRLAFGARSEEDTGVQHGGQSPQESSEGEAGGSGIREARSVAVATCSGTCFQVSPLDSERLYQAPSCIRSTTWLDTEQVCRQHLLSEWIWKGKSPNALHSG